MTTRDMEGQLGHAPTAAADPRRPGRRNETSLRHRTHRITLVISSLRAGGAERVLSRMANYWAERGWPVTLVTLEPTSSDFYELHAAVERVGLNASGTSTSFLRAVQSNRHRLKLLRGAIRASRPDVVISFMVPTTVITLLAARKDGVPVIVSERTDPLRCPLPPIWARLRRVTYKWAFAVVVQTPEVRRWADSFVPENAVHIIPNPIPAAALALAAREDAADVRTRQVDARVSRIVAMGRLDADKGFDFLLRAFAECRVSRREWELTILGEGEERARLESLANQLGVASQVHLPGYVSDPASVLREADLFVLASRYEGFPNALLEAMAVGLPVIATDCPYGPSHIVRNDIDGLLVPVDDAEALATAMAALMDDEPRRRRLGRRATEVTERFAVDRIMAMWESLVYDSVADRRSAGRTVRA